MTCHRQSFRVNSFDVDPFDQLTATALAGYLQESANGHVRALGWGLDALGRRGLTWVLGAMQVEIVAPIRERTHLTVQTWPSGRERLAVLRDYEVVDGAGAVVACAVSQWLLLDLERRRPVRPEVVIDPALLVEARHLLPPLRDKLPPLERWTEERRLAVRYQDIDVNLHANNAAYLSWLVDAVPEATWQGCRLGSAEVQYLAECRRGTTVLSRAHGVAPDAFEHTVVREEDGRELARARTRWVARDTPVGVEAAGRAGAA